VIQGALFPALKPHEQRWREFHDANPHVYEWLRDAALKLKARGRERYGIGALVEAFRFHAAMTTDGDDFKLNNNFRAFYARKIMAECPDLAGFFETRASVADEA